MPRSASLLPTKPQRVAGHLLVCKCWTRPVFTSIHTVKVLRPSVHSLCVCLARCAPPAVGAVPSPLSACTNHIETPRSIYQTYANDIQRIPAHSWVLGPKFVNVLTSLWLLLTSVIARAVIVVVGRLEVTFWCRNYWYASIVGNRKLCKYSLVVCVSTLLHTAV